ncbi:hypothetical protein COW64_20695, partial [bacterium (Candidatus Blackallbacteria) CG18_big_fil_WC_8_21_14_2_50_49_26]
MRQRRDKQKRKTAHRQILNMCCGMLLSSLLSLPTQAKPPLQPLEKELAVFLQNNLPAYRLANPEDYLPALSESDRGVTLIRADFDQDGLSDYAVLLLHRQTREARIYFLLRRKTSFQADLLLSWPALTPGPALQTPMFFKKAGEAGLTARDYNELQEIPNWEKLSNQERMRLRKAKAADYVSV